MKIVCCVTSFNFVHAGHLEHLEEANKLGDKLIVIVPTDEALKRQKGGHNFPLDVRLGIAHIIKWLNPLNEVIVSIDKDDTVADTLRLIKPNIFTKGGDRLPNRMPQKEVDVCKEMGCEIIYGVGRQLDHSSRIKKLILEA